MRFLIVFESSRVKESAVAEGFAGRALKFGQVKSARPNFSDDAMTVLQHDGQVRFAPRERGQR